MHIRAFKLRDCRLDGWHEKIAGRWSYRQLAADPCWRNGWISFDAVSFNPEDGLVYCGLNSIDGDLLYSFDPATGCFESLNTRSWADAFDVKIHRTLLRNPRDGCLYFATSMLHDADVAAPGGKLVRFDPRRGSYDLLGIPVPMLYIQSIAADFDRGLLYGFTYPAESVFRFDLETRRTQVLAWIGNAVMFSQPHNAVVDRDGWLWGTWGETRAWDETTGPCPIRLFKYHPEGGCVWYEHGLSRAGAGPQLVPDPEKPAGVASALHQTRHARDYGFCDSMAYDGGDYIYAGTVAGVLCRIEIATGKVEKVAHMIAAGRFPALALRDNVLYGGGGLNGCTQLIRWDTRTGRLDAYSNLIEPAAGETPARIHEIATTPEHTLYLGENDNHRRSSYLWQLHLD